MERQYIEHMRDVYSNWLIENGMGSIAMTNSSVEPFEPIFEFEDIVPEAKANLEHINTMIQGAIRDCDILQSSYALSAYKTNLLVESTSDSVARLLNEAAMESERLETFRYLTHKYDKFNNIIDVKPESLNGNYSEYSKYITAKVQGLSKVKYEIEDIEGNGYEGNGQVYNNGVFANELLDTSNREFVSSDKDINYYEYSRITSTERLEEDFSLINYDNIPAKCNITIKAESKVNSFNIGTLGNDIKVTDLLVSDNGVEYKSILHSSVLMNNAGLERDDVITFPLSRYVRISLESTYHTGDVIAMNYKEGAKVFSTARRSVIRFNNLQLYKNSYQTSGSYVATEKYENNSIAISVYSNEIIPQHFDQSKDYFKYILTINGVAHEVVPINSHRGGVKIIKTIDGDLEQDSIKILKDDIKTAKLSIEIVTDSQNETPLINNIKLLTSKSV